MEEAAMKLTIVGALVIVAVAILALLVLSALVNDGKQAPPSMNTDAE
jgi:hypothetical protein